MEALARAKQGKYLAALESCSALPNTFFPCLPLLTYVFSPLFPTVVVSAPLTPLLLSQVGDQLSWESCSCNSTSWLQFVNNSSQEFPHKRKAQLHISQVRRLSVLFCLKLEGGVFPANILQRWISNSSYSPAVTRFKYPTHVLDSLGMLAKGHWVRRAEPAWPPVWLSPWLTGCLSLDCPSSVHTTRLSCFVFPAPCLSFLLFNCPSI